MRKQEQHSVMVKNLCVSVCKIDTQRERERERERERGREGGTKNRYVPNINNYNINNH